MAVNTRLSAPSYKIFEPDALDVSLSQHVLNPLQGGIAGAMLLAHGADSAQSRQDYLANSDKFNEMARGLDAMEIAQKHQEARMKLAPGLLEHGTDASTIKGIEDLLTPEGILGNKTAGLFTDKTRAEIAALYAKANADKSGGADTYKITTTPPGSNQTIEYTTKRKPGTIDPSASVQVGPTAIDPTASTPTATSNNAPVAQGQQVIQRAMAAVGASDAKQLKAVQDSKGNYVVTNSASGKTATFDATGKQIR